MTPRAVRWIAVVVLVAGIGAGCGRDIGDLQGRPEEYVGKMVSVKGEVVNTISVFDRGFYQVEDRTGSIWVYSRQVPDEGQVVQVEGRLKRGIRIPGHSAGVVLVQSVSDD